MLLTVMSSLSAVWSKAWPFLVAILFFGVIIMVHELGHFVFAKLFKVKVNDFALGMGPALLKFVKGDTTYALRLFPIGGYCNMEGEDEESADTKSFSQKPVWQRFIIVAAGATVNLLLGFLLVVVMLSRQDLIGTPNIKSFYENASSAATGLKEGDRILEIDGKRVFSQYDVSFLMMRGKDGVIDFRVERGGKKMDVNDVRFETREIEGKTVIVYDFIIVGVEPSFFNVVKASAVETLSIARIVWISLFDLVTGRYGLSEISGPIGVVSFIAEAAEESVKTDLTPVLSLMALISVNIGIFNLLPVPALDGGRLFFMLIEIILRKPVPQKYERWIHAAGLIALFIFMAVISLKDILSLIRG